MKSENDFSLYYFSKATVKIVHFKVKRVTHISFFYNDVMLKGDRLIRNTFRKPFEEKYKHTKIALNIVIKQKVAFKILVF